MYVVRPTRGERHRASRMACLAGDGTVGDAESFLRRCLVNYPRVRFRLRAPLDPNAPLPMSDPDGTLMPAAKRQRQPPRRI
jgi:hypothetical protein